MRRNIWQQLPKETQKRLNNTACQEFKRRENELLALLRYDNESEVDNEKIEKELDKLYDELAPKDKAAIDAENDIEELNRDIRSFLYRSGSYSEFSLISDIESEQKYIESRKSKYVYPDYSELVGTPSADDFEKKTYIFEMIESSYRLKDERIADLMLLGIFQWKGLYIAKAIKKDSNSYRGWLVCTGPNYVPENALDVKQKDGYRKLIFNPFYGVRHQWLHDFLFDCDVELGNRPPKQKNQRVIFKDGNPYNCLPDNLAVISQKRGRPMICISCGKGTTKEDSIVIRENNRKTRYCTQCMRWITGRS